MNSFTSSAVFGVFVSLFAFQIGLFVARKVAHPLCNPLLVAIILVIAFLSATGISYEEYNAGAHYITLLMTPLTVSLAVPLYEQFEVLRRNWKALLVGIGAGVLTTLVCILAGAILFGLTHDQYVTMLPKGITSPIAMAVSEELGGYPAVTIALVVITGIGGNLIAQTLCRLFKITDPAAVGAALGTSAHALGTAKAMEFGSVQGAMSSIAIVVAGLITVVGAAIFAMFL